MEYKPTQTEKRLTETLCQMNLKEDMIITIMLLLPSEEEQKQMLNFLQENPQATSDTITEEALNLTQIVDE